MFGYKTVTENTGHTWEAIFFTSRWRMFPRVARRAWLAFQRVIRRREGQEKGKRAALALFRFQPDAPAMPLDQLAAEEESQTRSGDAMRGGIASPRKTGKEPGLLLLGDANAAVMNAYLDALSILSLGHSDVDGAALRRIFDGIGDQVQQHLFQPVAVPMQPDGVGIS